MLSINELLARERQLELPHAQSETFTELSANVSVEQTKRRTLITEIGHGIFANRNVADVGELAFEFVLELATEDVSAEFEDRAGQLEARDIFARVRKCGGRARAAR